MRPATPTPSDIIHDPTSILGEKKHTIPQIAHNLQVDPTTARRMFENEPGVLVLSTGSKPKRGKTRGYRVLRVPDSVLQRVLAKRAIA